MSHATGVCISINAYITVGDHKTWRISGKPLIHNGRKPR